MPYVRLRRPLPAALTACVAVGLGAITPAHAQVITDSPSLPVLNHPYVSTVGAGCFDSLLLCISPGSLTLTSLVSSSFVGGNQDITADASYVGMLTNLSGFPLLPVDLTGTMSEVVLGRTSDSATGSWTTDLTALSLTGLVLGYPFAVTLDPDNASTGETSVELLGGGPVVETPFEGPFQGADNVPEYQISSFFDVFVDLTLDSPTPMMTGRGPIEVNLVEAVPEPASLALLAAPLLALTVARRRRG